VFGVISAIGSVFSAVSAALKLLFSFFIYRAGETAQAKKDQDAALKDDANAQKTRDNVAGMSDADLDRALERVQHPGAGK
jgi:hypothetical protein